MELSQENGLKRAASIIGGTACAMMLISQLFAFAVSTIAMKSFPQLLQFDGMVWIISYVPLYLIAFPMFLIIMKKLPNLVPMREIIKLPINGFIKWLAICFAGMYIGNLISIIITTIIGAIKGGAVVNPVVEVAIGGSIIYNIIFGVIVAPIGEEYIFRHVMYKKLGGYGDKIYIAFSALLFAMFHGNLSQLVYAFLLGVIFAYLVARTHTVIYSLALHMIINLYGMVLGPLVLNNTLILGVLAVLIMAVSAIGVILFVRTVKAQKIRLEEPTQEISRTPVKDMLVNNGMIAYMSFMILIIIVATVV